MKVTAEQIHVAPAHRYVLWQGEMEVTVMQSTGVYGFHSCVIIIDRVDSPMETVAANWYDSKYRGMQPKPVEPMLEWIAERFTELSHGDNDNSCDVEGLKGE